MASPVTPRHITDWILQILVFMISMTVFYYLDVSMAGRAQANLFGFDPTSRRDGFVLGYLLTQTLLIFVLQACCRTLTDREIRLKGDLYRFSPWRMAQTAAIVAYFCVFLIWAFMAVPSGVNAVFVALVGFGCLSALAWPALIRSMDPSARDIALMMRQIGIASVEPETGEAEPGESESKEER